MQWYPESFVSRYLRTTDNKDTFPASGQKCEDVLSFKEFPGIVRPLGVQRIHNDWKNIYFLGLAGELQTLGRMIERLDLSAIGYQSSMLSREAPLTVSLSLRTSKRKRFQLTYQ